MYKLIKEFRADHGRLGEICLGKAYCDICKKICECITIDSSEGEYGTGNICFNCIDEIRKNLK